jgi:hypothetical protein
MSLLGPFQVDPEAIERLGAAFTQFVNELIVREGSRALLLGYQVRVDNQDNTGDGGVDATLFSDKATAWIAAGKSSWQFKRSDLAPAKCAAELDGAKWAHELLKSDATYTLVLGRRLGDKKIESRRAKLIRKAHELKLISSDEQIQVLDANALARWASEFPSLAVSALLGAPGRGVTDFATWSASNRHEFQWIPDKQRSEAIESIRSTVARETFSEIHVRGVSGAGKTRLVMEALRTAELSPLVVYVRDQERVSGDVVGYVLSEDRTAILVVDECAGRSHEKLAEGVPTASALRLVTIGEPDVHNLRAPVLELTTMDETELGEFLEANYPKLSPEARRVVSENSLGNVGLAIIFANRILEQGPVEAAELVSRKDVEQLVQGLLPEGRPFYLATILALVERVGWEKEVAAQLAPLASFAGATEAELRAVGEDLESRGLLVKQGRYRAVAPHPVAVVLAADAWRSEGNRIVDELLPTIDREMGLSLFSRVAALGRYEPARKVLRELMSRGGPFGSLASIEEHELGRVLTQLAIVAPQETMQHLGELIAVASLDDLRAATRSRRDLVWTLEKLAWHRQTFESAADSLLKLALAENETWANNATGTWVELFGNLLPGTAATPSERVEYLRRIIADGDTAMRLMVTKACTRALATHEAISVSAELQGGAVVEARGRPANWEEAGDYRRAVIKMLSDLVAIEDAAVSDAATDVLIGAVQSAIDDVYVGDDLIEALKRLPSESLTRLRRDIEHLINVYERHAPADRVNLVDRLRHLSAELPPADEREQIRVLLHLRPWDLQDDELRSRLMESLQSLGDEDREWLLEVVKAEELPAAWELGLGLAATWGETTGVDGALVKAFPLNPAALVGYLRGRVDAGDETAFDTLLDGPLATSLGARDELAVAARGPLTQHSRQRVLGLARNIPVAQAASALFGWQQNVTDNEAIQLVSDWLARVATQQDYNALIDWVNFRYPHDDGLPDPFRPLALKLLMKREAFPEMGQQRWDWAQLATLMVSDHAVDLAKLVIDLIDGDRMMVHREGPESQILLNAAATHPDEVWTEIAERLIKGSWRVQIEIRGWLLTAIPQGVLERWIGDDLERARLVATVAPVGGDAPTGIARFLLKRFSEDEEIRSSLWGEFMSGTWFGPESGRLAHQIDQLKSWRSQASEPDGVRRWAAEMVELLEARREQALQEEAEGGY